MSKKIIKETEHDVHYQIGGMLKENERFQTDAEWHGDLLDSIKDSSENSEKLLEEINSTLTLMSEKIELGFSQTQRTTNTIFYYVIVAALIFTIIKVW